MNRTIRLGILLLPLLGTGCVRDRFELDEETDWGSNSSEWGVPLGGGKLTLLNAQPWLETLGIQSEPITGNWEWVKPFDLFSYPADSLWSLPSSDWNWEQSLDATSASTFNALPPGVVFQLPLSGAIPLDFPEGMFLEELHFDGGFLLLNVNYNLDVPLDLALQFPYILQNGEPLVAQNSWSSPGMYQWEIPLAGSTLQIPGNQLESIPFEALISMTSNGNTVAAGEGVALFGTWNWEGWDWMTGSAGAPSPVSFSASTTIPVFDWGPGGILHIAEPRIDLVVENSTGIPVGWGLSDLIFWHEGVGTPAGGWQIESPPWIAGAPGLGLSAFTLHSIDNTGTNPELSTLIDLKPSSADWSGFVQPNPGGAGPNFITRNSSLTAKGNLRFPLFGYASGFLLQDTLDLAISAALEEALQDPLDWTDIASVTLRVRSTNGLPLTLSAQMLLLNEAFQPIDSLFLEGGLLLQGGRLDESLTPGDPNFGRVVEPGLQTLDIKINREQAQIWMTSGIEHLVIRAATSTQGAESHWDVRFYPEDALELQFAMRIEVDWNP